MCVNIGSDFYQLYDALCECENVTREEAFKAMMRPWAEYVLNKLAESPSANIEALENIEYAIKGLFNSKSMA